jgi:sterol desaturase/sphingolipid hydroxylase (fatty acid hydroxylase superfamily)
MTGDIQEIQPIAMVVGLVVLLLWEQAHPFFDFFRGRTRDRGMHVVRNLAVGGLNALLVAGLFVAAWYGVSEWAAERSFGLLHAMEEYLGLPLWAHGAAAVLLLDGWTYLWHRLNHRIPFLWRFHRVHHYDPEMDVTTASRFHVGEILFSSLLRLPLIALLGIYFWELLFYETLMFAVVQFHHANIALPARLDRVLRVLIVTPAMHKVHHSRERPETDSNYSSLLSVWDRIGRSFRMRSDLASLRLGLVEFDEPGDHTVVGILRAPLLNRPRRALAEVSAVTMESEGAS